MYQLAINNLGFQRDDRFLFRQLDCVVNESEAIQVLGENGSGKTTLLRIVVGLIHASEGDISWYLDDEVRDLRHDLMYLGHESGVKLALTAMENLRWYFALHGTKAANKPSQKAYLSQDISAAVLSEALEWAGLKGYEDIVCYDMSAGQRRRVALARLYLSQAPVWVLDEPFTAIDVAGVTRLEKRIEEHRNHGGMVVFTTHQRTELSGVRMLNVEDFKHKRDPYHSIEEQDESHERGDS